MVIRCSLTTLSHHTLRMSGARLLTHAVIYPFPHAALQTNNYCNGIGRINGKLTNTIMIDRGMTQGCTLSPTQFNVHINDLIECLNQEARGISFDDHKITSLLYAA